MTKIERVARALAVNDGRDPDGQSDTMAISSLAAIQRGEVVDPIWRDYEADARRFVACFDALTG